MANETVDKLAKKMADRIGHNMREKCYVHAEVAEEFFKAEKDDGATVLCSGVLVDLVVGLNLTALRLHEKNVENPKLGKEYSWNLRANILEDFAKAIECSIEKGS